MPQCYAIPGQHDLPYHNLNNVKQSAYWTLVEAGKIIDMSNGIPIHLPISDIILYPFPYGKKITPREGKPNKKKIHLLVAHRFVWDSKRPETAHENPPEKCSTENTWSDLTGYDICLFGDNHIPFLHRGRRTGRLLYNHGSFFRRSVAEVHHPEVGLVIDRQTIVRRPLESAKADVIVDVGDEETRPEDRESLDRFMKSLRSSPETHFRYSDMVRRYIRDEDPPTKVRKYLLQSLERR
jgi:hypothetical protein